MKKLFATFTFVALAVAAASSFNVRSLQAATFNIANADVSALKNAITAANTNGQDDIINLASSGTYTLTTVDNGANGLPIIRTDGGHTLRINGNRTTITRSTTGTPAFRILQIGSFALVTLNGVKITNGIGSGTNNPGGAIHNDHGTLTLINSTVSGNSVSDSQVSVAIAFGGGIFNDHGNLTLQNSTISGNVVSARSDNGSSAIASGGGLYNSDGIVTIKNCTISGNGASASSGSGMFGVPDASGGGIFNVGSSSGDASVIISSSTMVGNISSNGGLFPPPSVGIDNSGGTASVTLGNTIIVSTRLSNFNGMIVSNGYNLSDDNGSGFLTAIGDQINVLDPKIGALADHGGLTQTHSLLPGSAAIDKGKRNAISSLPVTTDQRGVARPFDFPGVAPATGGDSSDIGAFELNETLQSGPNFTVNTLADHNDALCGSLDCTLREAIIAANNSAGGNAINFLPALKGTIQLNQGLPTLIDNTTIAGPGANNVTVRRNTGGDYRIFTITNATSTGPVVSISGLTISNGQVSSNTFPDNTGGGIFNDHGTLTVANCRISSNSATVGLNAGGAIYNNGANSGQATLTLTSTTLDGNSANFFGGAVCNDGTTNGSATATVTNCTFSGNNCTNGGAIANLGAANGHATLVVRSSTFSGNTSSFGGAFDLDAQNGGNSNLAIRNTLLKTGVNGANFSVNNGAIVTSEGHNISDDPAGGVAGTAPGGLLNGTGDKRNTDPKLDAAGLKNNGGIVQTIALTATSPAINYAVSAPARDARNYLRNGAADVGAFEFKGTLPVALANISTRALVQTGDNVLIGGFIITGTQNIPVLLRAIGPSLALAGKLMNPSLELRNSSGALIVSNDNWGSASNHQEIANSGLAPTNALESAILRSLAPGAYTAIMRGVGNTSGIALVEGYDLDRTVDCKFVNISTRGLVQTGDNVMIGGFIVAGADSQKVIIRAIGPSLPLAGKLSNPTLELHNGQGALVASNDNWRTTQQAEIIATGIPPPNNFESAIVRTLTPGAYTAIVRGAGGATGLALVEIYGLN
jgi:CSLREA domain-containing protein